MKRTVKFFSSIAAVACIIGIGVTTAPVVGARTPDRQPVALQSAAQYLVAQDDGTLAFADGAVSAIPQGDRDAAAEALRRLNDDVVSGRTKPFSSDDDRLKVPIGDNDVQPMGNCFCGTCCSQHMCCSGGWWLFCWNYKTC